jgi:hypothetical protein
MELTMWRQLRKNLPDLDKDDVLDLIGLESRRSTAEKVMPSLALFGAGVLLGVGLGLMLAPKPGVQLRHDLKDRLGKGHNGTPDSKPKTAESSARTV